MSFRQRFRGVCMCVCMCARVPVCMSVRVSVCVCACGVKIIFMLTQFIVVALHRKRESFFFLHLKYIHITGMHIIHIIIIAIHNTHICHLACIVCMYVAMHVRVCIGGISAWYYSETFAILCGLNNYQILFVKELYCWVHK